MSPQISDLLFVTFVTLFLSGFAMLWLWTNNSEAIKAPVRKAFAIMRLTRYGKAPVLCGRHIEELITRKGRMALLDNENCEVCTKKSKLI